MFTCTYFQRRSRTASRVRGSSVYIHTHEHSYAHTYMCVHIFTHTPKQLRECVGRGSSPHRNTLQHPATPCNTLQHHATHTHPNGFARSWVEGALHPATPCNTLQHPATPYNTYTPERLREFVGRGSSQHVQLKQCATSQPMDSCPVVLMRVFVYMYICIYVYMYICIYM